MQFSQLKADILGGITAGIVALPLALAFGVQSGLGAVTGVYGAIAVGFFAALLGGTPSQVSGPTGPMTVVTAILVINMINHFGSLTAAMPYILATFVLAGLLQILFGVMRLGQAIKYIPYPVVSGFMSGIGVIIILFQVFPALGQASPKKVIDILWHIQQALAAINSQAVLLTLSTVVIIYLFPKITKILPSSLVALIVMSVVSGWLKLTVPTIGEIPMGWPKLQWEVLGHFSWENFSFIVLPALTLAALGSIDSLLTSIVADNVTKTRHNSNQELVGQGVGNMVAGLISGLPGAGATMRTMVNIGAGGRGRLSGITHSLLLLTILLGLGTYAAQIPMAVLAGILISVGISIIDYRSLKHIIHIPKGDVVIMAAVFLLTVFVDLIQAVALGMVLASLFFMKKMSVIMESNTRMAPLKEFHPETAWDEDEIAIVKEWGESVYIKHIEGPLFFGFVSQFRDMVEAVPSVEYVIIRMKYVPYIDQSGLYGFEEAMMYLNSRNIAALLVGVQSQPMDMFKGIDLIPNLISDKQVFKNLRDCMSWLKQRLVDKGRQNA